MKLTMGTHPSLGNFLETHPTQPVLIVQISAALSFYCVFSFRAAMNSMSSQPCRPISTQSITSTDSADSEENYVAMVSPIAGDETAHCILSLNDLRL